MAWSKRSRHERGYGSNWSKLRIVIRNRDDGLCQPCKRAGRLTPFVAVDHIKPKSQGGTDDHDNLECICGPCHDAKSKAEADTAQEKLRREAKTTIGLDGWPVIPKRWGYSIPHGMRPAACTVKLVCGPPASGKTTYVKASAAKADKIIDLDEIKVRLGGKLWDDDESITARAIRYRDMAIRGLADRPKETAWLIVTAPTKAERAAWMDALGPQAELIEIVEPVETCLARIAADPRRKALAKVQGAIAERWER